MLKRTLLIVLSIFVGSELFARDISVSQKFIGVEIGITEVQGEAASEVDGSISNGTSFGLRLGAQNEQWRTTIGFNYFDNENRNVEKLFLAIDYFFLSYDLMGEYALQPYLGANVGYMNYESPEIDEDGFLYGGQVGLVLNLLKEIDLDIGYRYSLSAANALDHTSDVLFGLNYKY